MENGGDELCMKPGRRKRQARIIHGARLSFPVRLFWRPHPRMIGVRGGAGDDKVELERGSKKQKTKYSSCSLSSLFCSTPSLFFTSPTMSGLAAAAARIPAALLVDSYKSSHFLLYPDDCEEMQAVRLV